jgi:hypothetical protein
MDAYSHFPSQSQMAGYSHYPFQYPMHHGSQLNGQLYPHQNVDPTFPFQSADAPTYEEISSAEAVRGEVTISVKGEQPGK